MKKLIVFICLIATGMVAAQNNHATSNGAKTRVVTQSDATISTEILKKISSVGKINKNAKARVITKENGLPLTDPFYQKLMANRAKTVQPIVVTKNSSLTVRDPKILNKIQKRLSKSKN